MNTRVSVALFFLVMLAASPVYAAETVNEEHVDVSVVVVELNDSSTVIDIEYEQGLALKIDTLLFGSESLESSLEDVLNVRDPEFESLSTDSATLVLDKRLRGNHSFGQTIERVEIRDGEWRVFYDKDSVYFR